MKKLMWVMIAILASTVIACAKPYDQDLIESVKNGSMTRAQADAEQGRRDAQRDSAKALQLIVAAGEESDYWPCLRGIIQPFLPAPTETNQKVFKPGALDGLVTDAQTECDSHWPNFVNAAVRKAKDNNLDDDVSENQSAFRRMVHDLWYQELAKVYAEEPNGGAGNLAAGAGQQTSPMPNAGIISSPEKGVESGPVAAASSDTQVGSRAGKELEGYGPLLFSMTMSQAKKVLGNKAKDVGACEFALVHFRCLEFVDLKETTKFLVTAYFSEKHMRYVSMSIQSLAGKDNFASDECWRLMEETAVRYAMEFGNPDDGFPIKKGWMGEGEDVLTADSVFTFPKGGKITVSGVEILSRKICSVGILYER